jgi:hypothetical protein
MVARAGGLQVAPGQGFFYLDDRRCIGGHAFLLVVRLAERIRREEPHDLLAQA